MTADRDALLIDGGDRFDDWRQSQLAEQTEREFQRLELQGAINQLKLLRDKTLELVDLAESFDSRLADEYGCVRAKVDAHLSQVLLRRELLADRQTP
jgi:transcriptional regulator of aromatic amino acid metabolism